MPITAYLHTLFFLLILYYGGRGKGLFLGTVAMTGLLCFSLLGFSVGSPPYEVVEILLAISLLLAALERAGGMALLSTAIDRSITYYSNALIWLAPLIAFFLTVVTGSGYISLLMLPLIVEVAKKNNLPPVKPLVASVIAAQLGIIGSPVSAAMSLLLPLVEPMGLSSSQILRVVFPSTLIGVLCVSAFVTHVGRFKGEVTQTNPSPSKPADLLSKQLGTQPRAPLSVALLFTGLLILITTSLAPSLVSMVPQMPRHHWVTLWLSATAMLIVSLCRVETRQLVHAPAFLSSISAAINVFGVAWLGNTFVSHYASSVLDNVSMQLTQHPMLFPLVTVFTTTLFYSQAATTKILIPIALQCHVTPVILLSSFIATAGLFLLPTYPTLLAAIEVDHTGSTRIGKWWINHSFLLPGLVGIGASIAATHLILG